MKLIFTQKEIDNYTKQRPEGFHPFYKDAVRIAYDMRVHADGIYPQKMIEERRPNEPLEVKDYRKIIWKPKTKPTFSKIFSELQKIRRSSEWGMRFDDKLKFPLIREGETLEDYTTKYYPGFDSITNWAFTLLLRKYIIDPNAVCIVLPDFEDEVAETDFVKPIPVIYESHNVIDFVQDDFVVVNDPKGAWYTAADGRRIKGRRIIIVTTKEVIRYDQINGKGEFSISLQEAHELPELPAFQLKGVIIDQIDFNYLYESRIAGIIPELDEALREYSDLQAGKVCHLYAERWEYSQHECTACKGTSRRRNSNYTGPDCNLPEFLTCEAPGCVNGYVVAGPYSKIIIRPNHTLEGQSPVPNPPAGFIEKDVEIIKVMEESVEKHIYSALSAINFEFLGETPLSESGKAKQVDQDALNNTVHSIAEDLVSVIDNVVRITAFFRYKNIYSSEDIFTMLPAINVPERYAVMASTISVEEFKALKESGASAVILAATEMEVANRRLQSDNELLEFVTLCLKLDPLASVTEDNKMSMLSNKGITQVSYIISSNIQEFVKRAMLEDPKFAEKDTKKQLEVLKKYADEVVKSTEIKVDDLQTDLEEDSNLPGAVQQPDSGNAAGDAGGSADEDEEA